MVTVTGLADSLFQWGYASLGFPGRTGDCPEVRRRPLGLTARVRPVYAGLYGLAFALGDRIPQPWIAHRGDGHPTYGVDP
jgi:hypothetical protein